MAKDIFSPHVSSIASGFSHKSEDSGYKIKGEIFWTLTDTKLNESTKGYLTNLVVLDAGILIARLMKSTATPNVSEPKFGIYALAVGTGDVGWNPMNPPPANVNQRSLYNELARKSAASTSFIDSIGAVSAVPTHIVDFLFTFSESEAVGPLTEMGLIGGDISTNMSLTNPVLPPNGPYDPTVDLTGKDTLCNYLTFPVINKPATSTLSLTYRLTF